MKVIQEPDVVNGRAVVGVAAGVVLAIALGVGLAWALIPGTRPERLTPSLTPARMHWEEPRVSTLDTGLFDVEPPGARETRQALERLRSHGVVDRERQTVHIPIEQAMELYTKRAGGKP